MFKITQNNKHAFALFDKVESKLMNENMYSVMRTLLNTLINIKASIIHTNSTSLTRRLSFADVAFRHIMYGIYF